MAKPIITGTCCYTLENLRLAIEVLKGLSVKFSNIDFNTGRATVRIGGFEKPIGFFESGINQLHFTFDVGSGPDALWYLANFERSYARVIADDVKHCHKLRGHSMWVVGYSFVNRWEEPRFPESVADCAKARGLSLGEYLNS